MQFSGRATIGAMVLLTLALPAHAEVMDKEPTAASNWAWAVLGGLAALAAWRVRWWLGLPVTLVVLFCLYAFHLEIQDPFVGPAIRDEAGSAYITQFYAAAVIGALLNAIGVYGCIVRWGKRRRRATTNDAHDGVWSRRKESEIFDDGNRLGGAGVSAAVLERTASLLGTTLTARASESDEYEEDISIGSIARGDIHDDCFFRVEPVSVPLKRALLQSVLELHGTYLGVDVDWSAVLPPLQDLLGAGIALRLRSSATSCRLSVRAYPHRSNLLIRFPKKSSRWNVQAVLRCSSER